MSRQDAHIPTPDGEARAFAFTPDQGQGPWPAVIFYTDAFAIRPAVFGMAERLAGHGYYVLVPDLYWRLGAYPTMDPASMMNDEANRSDLFNKFIPCASPQNTMRDTGAMLDWLAKQPKAKADRVGVTGYCMGGGIALRAAGTFPDRIAAAGAFHAGRVATDAPDSPHLLAPHIKAKVFVAGGDEDPIFDEDECARLTKALADAKVDAEVTIYRGAKHGYAPPDMPAYDHEAAERHWRDMVALFDSTLKQPAMA
jgi:carboxymethylenebutenolidase